MDICLEQGADLHMAQLMPLPLTVSCFSKIQIGFAFLVPAHPGSPGQRAVKRVCVCVFVCFNILCVRLENAYACPQNGGFTGKNWESRTFCSFIPQLYFVSAVVAVASSHMSSSSSASWTRFSPPSNFVNGHVSTVWFMVCLWPQSQKGDWARPHLCKLARHGP